MDLQVQAPHHQPIKPAEELKQKKKGAVNRRVLQEISNLVNLNHEIPIIKGLGALSLENDREAAIKKDTNQVEERERKAYVRSQNKIVPKPEPGTVIIISSDEEEEADNEKLNKKKRDLSGNRSYRKKKLHSLTYVLTARSKMACGLSLRPPEQVLNIDAADTNNELAVVEYVEDIYKYYKMAEDENRVSSYMPWQCHINEKMRMILVDWLIEVHNKFDLMPETLYLTIDIVDRYLSRGVVSRKELQLLGIGSMLLACKYEEIWAPEANDFVCISDNAYTREQLLAMEKQILGKLEWTLTVATPYVFLVRFIKATFPADNEVENMAFYLAETGLMHYQVVVSFCPSLIAAASVFAAIHSLGRTPVWTETLKHYTDYSENQLKECAKMLINCLVTTKDRKLKGVQKKFSSTSRGAVALLPISKSLV